ncbi:uncharacterized protein LOC130987635 isoform X1 [Salvia miltiorrhiza]|uniref:uncharacterized protein LOC130987635 isoform X1 n=1 Tax=Salvia miltiorrhiza TaxID=226208 RepID=UPI0025AD1C3B|nr:uncharacterized protein LOC130987635 isoform X1 [Salvia miltiorrhiza]
MVSSATAPFANGGVLLSSAPRLSAANSHSSAAFNCPLSSRWGLQREQNVRLFPRRITGQAIRVLANPNASSGKGKAKKEVVMVDPLEAKRLATKQMELIKAKEKFKRRRQIEAINGAWAMVGLTAGLVIEGHTGKSILAQLSGYWDAVVGLIVR